jgi:hypothetical protein
VSSPGYSLSALEAEIAELRKDYQAFGKAYDLMRQRLLESNETPRTPELHTWSGTRAVVGSLEMAIHAVERTILEYDALIQKVRLGELENTDVPTRPVLSLVKETDKP